MPILRTAQSAAVTQPDPLVSALLQVALFHGLSRAQLERIAADAERRIFHAGEVITSAGKPADAAFLIVAGPAFHVPNPADPSFGQTVVPGSVIGEMAMLIEHTYGATVVARGPVRALRITRAALQAHMLEDASLAEHLVQQMAQRLVHAAAELRRVDEALQTALDSGPLDAVSYEASVPGYGQETNVPRGTMRH